MMANTCEKPLSHPSYDGLDNPEGKLDCHAREAALQDKLVDCLFRIESENTSCGALDALLNQFDEVAPLPKDKAFDIETNLVKLYKRIYALFYTASANPVSPTTSQHCVYQFCISPPLATSPCVYGESRQWKTPGLWARCGTCATVTEKSIQ